jgi:hypothetical protein
MKYRCALVFLAPLMLACFGLLVITGSYAAGPFDGKWVGTAPEAGDCGQLVVTLTITDSKISGTVAGKYGSPSIESGVVAVDGSAKVQYAAQQKFDGAIQFSGGNFRGNFKSFCGLRDVVGSRR